MRDFSHISRQALTVLAGQLAVMAFGVTDTIVAGRYSADSLAALSVASAIFVSVYVALNGLLQALLPIWAQQHGAGETEGIGRSLRQSMYLCAAASLVGIAILLSPEPLLRWTEVPSAMRGEVTRYLAVLALALPPGLLFRIYSTLNQSLGRPQLVTWLQVGALFVKLPLSIWFTFGGAGLPAMGVVGCAWATLVVNVSLMLMALYLLRTQAVYRPLGIWRRLERPDWTLLRRFARLGVPAGLAIMVEVTSFTLMALFIARQGATAAAAHQITSNIVAVLYMVPLSLGIATSARVSFWLGAGQPERAQQTVFMGFKLGVGVSACLIAILLIAKESIGRIYSTDAHIVALTAGVLMWAALYHAADSVQTLCIFVLRCYHVTVAPLVIYCVLLWGAGLGGGYILAYRGMGPWPANASPTPFWAASAVALIVTSALFCFLVRRALQRAR